MSQPSPANTRKPYGDDQARWNSGCPCGSEECSKGMQRIGKSVHASSVEETAIWLRCVQEFRTSSRSSAKKSTSAAAKTKSNFKRATFNPQHFSLGELKRFRTTVVVRADVNAVPTREHRTTVQQVLELLEEDAVRHVSPKRQRRYTQYACPCALGPACSNMLILNNRVKLPTDTAQLVKALHILNPLVTKAMIKKTLDEKLLGSQNSNGLWQAKYCDQRHYLPVDIEYKRVQNGSMVYCAKDGKLPHLKHQVWYTSTPSSASSTPMRSSTTTSTPTAIQSSTIAMIDFDSFDMEECLWVNQQPQQPQDDQSSCVPFSDVSHTAMTKYAKMVVLARLAKEFDLSNEQSRDMLNIVGPLIIGNITKPGPAMSAKAPQPKRTQQQRSTPSPNTPSGTPPTTPPSLGSTPPPQTAPPPPPPPPPGSDDDDDFDFDDLGDSDEFSDSFDLIAFLKADRRNCMEWTGQPGWDCVVLLYAYVDADNAFSTGTVQLRTWKTIATASAGAQTKRGRPPVLSPFQQFLFFLIAYRRFRGRGRVAMLAAIFNISTKTGHRYYKTWLVGISRFSQGQQPPATRLQALKVTPIKTKEELALRPGECAFMGDATERWTDAPFDAGMQTAMFSNYKKKTTVKIQVITTFNSYVTFISEAFCGGSTDNGSLAIAGVKHII